MLTRPEEGALAKSLYFQFRDGPVNLVDHAAKLHSEALRDAKYWRIWTDISVEVSVAPTPSAAADLSHLAVA